jgi:preprotein translocase subunit SecD
MAKVLPAGVVIALAAWLGAPSAGEEPAKPKVTVEFRWIEPQVVKGVTEDKGHPVVCGGKDWFAHLKPVLTSRDIASAKVTHLNFANNDQYAVEFTLAMGAAKKLAEACGDEPGRHLTVYVDGHWYGTSYFDKAKPEEFSPPLAGFMLSKTHAERILEASK